jgi:hypothetical protein
MVPRAWLNPSHHDTTFLREKAKSLEVRMSQLEAMMQQLVSKSGN